MDDDFDTKVEARRRAAQQKLAELGLVKLTSDLRNTIAAKTAAAARLRKPRKYQPREPVEPRRSTRERAQVTYNEDVIFNELMPQGSRGGGGGTKRPLELTAEEVELVEALTAAKKARTQAAARGTSKGPRGPRDSGRGVRRQGGQVYDSSNGITCHWCRQKTITAKVTCTHPLCGGGRSMPRSFCEKCLWNRHGEDVEEAKCNGNWICPTCRGSCGLGCICCCNCGPCRKKHGLPPTDKIKNLAEAKGFNNAHDYLVSLVTGETPEQLTARKVTFLAEVSKKAQEAKAATASEGTTLDVAQDTSAMEEDVPDSMLQLEPEVAIEKVQGDGTVRGSHDESTPQRPGKGNHGREKVQP
ncbi:hypothetical protein Vretimale_11863 [Volvox reticuliferus]|uniref:Zinc-finger domain-containing protein n=1 Tax=Volvox reticuliferus TaxID=1737510 RepID=A0A8J4LRC6_9CHLO|nr:hypothetical protein Vretimale_11863 [Volvox reticuliferus]